MAILWTNAAGQKVIGAPADEPKQPKRTRDMTEHSELCARAVKWLKNSRGCTFAVAELVTLAGEQPDAFGYGGDGSIVVECKTSRADFAKDKQKWFRRNPSNGMGNLRYFLTPPGLVSAEEVPDNWGLLYCLPKQIKVVKKPSTVASNLQAERTFLCSIIRRCSAQVDLTTI